MVSSPNAGRLRTAAGRCLPGFERINRYWDREVDVAAAKILPGEFYVSASGEMIITVLGSCVSACVRDPVFGVGGMNHFMLPMDSGYAGDAWRDSRISASARYGNVAMEQLINEILKNGGSRENLEVKLFGGGRIIRSMTDVGRRNIEFVRRYIESEGLKLVGEDLGGSYPRKVRFFPATGKAQVRKLRQLHNDTILSREEAYLRDIGDAPVEGGVELF
jgi:chemotaxis protein CheD